MHLLMNVFVNLHYTELDLYQSKGKIPEDVLLLAIDDPKPGIGSGSATLNALLVVTEHLSARAGYTVRLLETRIFLARIWDLTYPIFLMACDENEQ